MATTQPAFPSPQGVAPPSGAEGWEQLYPYYLISRDETREADEARFWFADSMHFGHVMYPFDTVVVDAVFLACGQNSARIFALPPALGLDIRIVNGYVYVAPIPVTDPDEIGRRVQHFQERAGHYFGHWEELYENWKTKVQGCIDRMAELSFPVLQELDPIEVVTEGRGRSTAFDLMRSYHTLLDEFFLVWQYHFEMLNLGYGAYITFFQFCKQAFPEIPDQTVARMVAGLDVLAFRPDQELRKLAQLALDLGVDDVLEAGGTPQGILDKLGTSDAGRRWVATFEEARDPWFNYSTEYGFYHDQESWNSDLSVPFTSISRYVELLRRGENLSRSVDQLRRERDAIVDEYRGLLSEQERPQFEELLGLSTTVFPFIEEHNIFVEHWAHTVFWRKVRELGATLVDFGLLDDVEDVFMLSRFELDTALFDTVDSWATGVPARGPEHWRTTIAERRRIMDALRTTGPLPALGAAPPEITDPFAIMNYGITTERVAEWLGGGDTDADEHVLTGIPASSGTVEGTARVIRSERQLDEVVEGEILVCPATAPSWAPVFAVVKAVVSDIGGMMSHAAIVCREYGVPSVVGTGFATSRIRTGQRLRVDGATGQVTILE